MSAVNFSVFFACLLFFILPAELCASKNSVYDGKTVAAFNNDCEKLLLDNIKRARKSIYGAIYTFTNKDIAEALIDRAGKKVEIHLKIDKEQAKFSYTKVLIRKMREAGIKILLIASPEDVRMHHKFAVIDDKIVLTGSFNWTRKASNENNENLVRIKSEGLAGEFLKAWHQIK